MTLLRTKTGLASLAKRDRYLLAMIAPVVAYLIVFCYLPMTGLFMAFTRFRPGQGFLGIYSGEWVGLKWFRQFFESPYCWRLIRNTFLLSFYSLVFGFPIPVFFAVCITQIRNDFLQKAAQVITYLPYFISTVVIAGMMTNFLSPGDGIINQMIAALGGTPRHFLGDSGYFRAIYVISGSWQTFGFNSIIFVAAIMGISPSLYEAMRVDGASKRKIIWHLVLPSIRPTVVLLLVMSLGNLLNVGFEKVYLLYNSGIYETADVISTYVYRQGIENKNFSYATAVGLFNSLIGFAVVFASNKLSAKISDTSIW